MCRETKSSTKKGDIEKNNKSRKNEESDVHRHLEGCFSGISSNLFEVNNNQNESIVVNDLDQINKKLNDGNVVEDTMTSTSKPQYIVEDTVTAKHKPRHIVEDTMAATSEHENLKCSVKNSPAKTQCCFKKPNGVDGKTRIEEKELLENSQAGEVSITTTENSEYNQEHTPRCTNGQSQNTTMQNDPNEIKEGKNTLTERVFNQKNRTRLDTCFQGHQPTTEEEIKNIFKSQFTSKTKVIALHGPSASGKSTLAQDLKDVLSKKYNVFVMSTDSFYKSFTGKNINDWDFDNPGAIDWENAHKVLRAIHDGDTSLPYYKYSFLTHKSEGPFYIENTKPDIIIVEGILALNLFSEYNFVDFSPVDPKKGKIIKNTHSYPNFSVLKIKLNICREKMRDVKIKRDIAERGRTFERASYQFEFQVWPATVKYVENTIFKADIHLIHGTFNTNGYKIFFSAITNYFLNETVFPMTKSTYLNVIGCYRECFLKKVDGLILWDH